MMMMTGGWKWRKDVKMKRRRRTEDGEEWSYK
jgi:hypothetical protein